MKKIFIYIMLLLSVFALTSCKEAKVNVTIHYNDIVETREVKKGSTVNFENLDDLYLLVGWYSDEECTNLVNGAVIDEDTTVYAKTIALGTEYKITYNLNGGVFNGSHPNKYYVGESITLATPEKQYYYDFTGWTMNGETISEITATMYGDIVLDANWNDSAKYYTISYELNGGTTSVELVKSLRQGDSFELPELTPANEKDCFLGWYTDSSFTNKVKTVDQYTFTGSNTTITLYARFGKRDAEHTLISFLGDSITTYSGYCPSGYEIFYPYKSDVDDVSKTWWMNLTNQLGYTLLMNDSYSGSCVGGTKEYAAKNLARVQNLRTDTKTPDIVVVYMGTNDWAAGRSNSEFKADYTQMINYIYQVCGEDTIIYPCLMPINNYADGFQTLRENLNSVIISIATEYNLTLIDFRNAITKDNLEATTYLGCHPNALGMTQMANEAYKVIYETDKDNLSK